MNLSEALDAALPEIPKTRLARSRPPCLNPDLIVREDVMEGEPFVGVLERGKANYFRFPPAQWQLALLFDGVRSYEEIAELYNKQHGGEINAEDARAFADNMEEADFWYKTAQEKNLALSEKLIAQRSRRAGRKSKIDFAHISFSAWDPDRYLGWLDRGIGNFLFSRWCVLAVILLFCFEAAIFVAKWNVIGPDIPLYYNFTHKSALDLLQFWLLFLTLGFFHETAHGLTCKHYGGEVHSMGLMFLYLTPAFYVDVTETWISATKLQRLATIIAGIWVEMVICGIAMFAWVNSTPGEWLHDFAYQVILITGLAVILINLNPLIKLDGYYFLTEVIDIPDLKERSTAFLSGWFQSHVLRLPVETPVVPKRRVALFAIYAFASGLYSYLLLLVVVRFSYNVAANWLAEFALIPAGILAFVIFRSRLSALRRLGSQLWAKSFAGGRPWRPTYLIAAAVILVLLFVPLWRDREGALFVIEPLHSITLHAAVPGRVNAVLIREGEQVRPGQLLLRMESPAAASMGSAASAETGGARFQAFSAEMDGRSIGTAAAEQNAAVQATTFAREAQSSLTLIAPSAGVVLTRDPEDLLDQSVASGESLITVAAGGGRAVRLYVPASALDRLTPGAQVGLALPGRISILRMTLAPLGGGPVKLPEGLIARQDYKGIELPVFYSTRMQLPASEDDLPIGLSGHARIFGQRRSLAQRGVTLLLNLVKAHVW
ncbi:MAG: HlyD family efflux transporter periplasmic adaptor subunit [Acidobacteriaceae bacterium]